MRTMSRRRALFFFGAGAGAAGLAAAGCASGSDTATTSTAATTTASTSVAAAPQETAGPYPGDGSNGPNVLVQSGVVRSDITTSFGGFTGTADGVPMTLRITLKDLANSGAAGTGMAVYVWHCDRDGEYSLYGSGITEQNYLRGVQVADADGTVTFTSIFPACYSGRWPHIHFEVYDSLEVAIAGENARLTSQIALPQDACEQVFAADPGYAQSTRNIAQVSLDSDNVFGDGWDAELATVTGSPSDRVQVAITVGVAEKSQNTQSQQAPPGGGPPGGPPPGR
ncbi:intradiol ring-cleavage dioxygenase [Nocardia sp. NPDC057227]|uniref:intradiol ring-cleavage dioxygenase n=1 Tax=Nocardia sp. NPDC057227 TaxID=3346056 RepID=UPI0036447AB2